MLTRFLSLSPLRLAFLFMLVFVSGPSLIRAQTKKKPCAEPVKILVRPKFTESDNATWKGKSVTATVSLLVSEDGHVVRAAMLKAKPKEASAAVLAAAKQAEFQPRRGCGDWQLEITFNLHPD